MAMPTWAVGQVLTASDVNTWFVPIVAIKAADESVTSSTALQDDNHLTVSVAANSSYQMTGQLLCDGAQAADVQTHWVGPAGAVLDLTVCMLTITAASTADDVIRQQSLTVDQNIGCLGAGVTSGATFQGVLTIAGTAGTFKLQWAQVVSSGTASKLLTNSFFVLRRIS